MKILKPSFGARSQTRKSSSALSTRPKRAPPAVLRVFSTGKPNTLSMAAITRRSSSDSTRKHSKNTTVRTTLPSSVRTAVSAASCAAERSDLRTAPSRSKCSRFLRSPVTASGEASSAFSGSGEAVSALSPGCSSCGSTPSSSGASPEGDRPAASNHSCTLFSARGISASVTGPVSASVKSDAPMSATRTAASAMKLRKSPRFAPSTTPSTSTSAKIRSTIRPLSMFLTFPSRSKL